MLDILLSDPTDEPLYLQLYKQIRRHIRSGVIRNGTRLPSVRSLQVQLNISKTPVETAYQMLTAEGYAVSRPRSGLYVVNPHEFQSSDGRQADDADADAADLGRPIWTPAPENDNLIDFDPSSADKQMFPVRIWRQMLNRALEHGVDRIGQYGDPQGEYALRSVLADYLRSSRGVVCSPEQIVIGSGISYSIGLLTKLLAGVRHVGIEEPGFVTVRERFRLNGFRVIPIPVHDKGLSLEQLEAGAAEIVYVTPSHQFPTGSVMPYAEREVLLNWAGVRKAYIIEDDYDGEFRYFGKPIPSLQSLDRHGRVIYIGTFSKAFTPALRMNYMVLPMDLARELHSIHHLLLSPSRIEQWAMQAFIEQGHWYRHIRKMRNMYRKKHRRLLELIHAHLNSRVDITGHSAGLHIQLTVKTRHSAEQLLKLAADKGVRIYDFHQMWMNRSPHPFGYPAIYLGFGGIGEADMEAGIARLAEAWAGILDQ